MCVSLFSLAKAGVGLGVGAFSFFLSHTQPEGERENVGSEGEKSVLFLFLLCARESVCENGFNFWRPVVM